MILKTRVPQRVYSAKIQSGSMNNYIPLVKLIKNPTLGEAGGTEGSFCKDQQVIFEEWRLCAKSQAICWYGATAHTTPIWRRQVAQRLDSAKIPSGSLKNDCSLPNPTSLFSHKIKINWKSNVFKGESGTESLLCKDPQWIFEEWESVGQIIQKS